jgi:hypothetical protein
VNDGRKEASDDFAGRRHFFLAEQRMLHMRSLGAQPHPPPPPVFVGGGAGPGAGAVPGPVFDVAVDFPVPFTGVFEVDATADELAAGASVGGGAAVGGAVSSGGGVAAVVATGCAAGSTGGGPLDAMTNTPIIAPTAKTAPMPTYSGVRFFWGFAGSELETVGAAVDVVIDGALIWNKPPGSSRRFGMAGAADACVAATLAAKALRSMRPESSLLSGLDELEDEARAPRLGPLLAPGVEATREVRALSENNADCSSLPAPIRAGAGAFGAENSGASA